MRSLRFVARTVREDLSCGLRDLLVNTIAGAALMPRVGRVLIYRLPRGPRTSRRGQEWTTEKLEQPS